jgi:hypothetical protein
MRAVDRANVLPLRKRCVTLARIFNLEAAMKRIEFWLWFIAAFGLYLMAYGKLGKIADDVAVIRATITQQPLPVKSETDTLPNGNVR